MNKITNGLLTTILYHRINHSMFPFLCIGENNGTVLKLLFILHKLAFSVIY